ncbi:hypothetical protein HDV04_005485 [Boothiomyces sp. JEL0838]|nr:hypothetical protein HDV04_005485 [Boothiomyces sp. JEL0838]
MTDQSKTILEYLNTQARPYNSSDIYLNLKQTIPKAQIQKILLELKDKELITGKQYGKQWIFAPKYAPVEEEEVINNEELEFKLQELKNINRTGEKYLQKLKNIPTLEEAEKQIVELQVEIDRIQKEINELKDTDTNIDPEIEQTYGGLKKEWVKRRRMFYNFFDQLCESKSPKELKQELELEFDQDHGVNVNDY